MQLCYFCAICGYSHPLKGFLIKDKILAIFARRRGLFILYMTYAVRLLSSQLHNSYHIYLTVILGTSFLLVRLLFHPSRLRALQWVGQLLLPQWRP